MWSERFLIYFFSLIDLHTLANHVDRARTDEIFQFDFLQCELILQYEIFQKETETHDIHSHDECRGDDTNRRYRGSQELEL